MTHASEGCIKLTKTILLLTQPNFTSLTLEIISFGPNLAGLSLQGLLAGLSFLAQAQPTEEITLQTSFNIGKVKVSLNLERM